MTVRKFVYGLIWGAVLLGLFSMLPLLPRVVRFAMSLFCLVVNAPGSVTVNALLGYLWLRTVAGYLLGGLITTVLAEPVLRWVERPARRQPDAGALVTRRALLLAGGGLAGGGFLVGYSTLVERRNFYLRTHRLYVPNLPPRLAGLRVVLMADLHCGPFNRPGDLRPAIAMANRCKPDLILIPGDFVHASRNYFAEAAELLQELRPTLPDGLLISWGNHDYWNDVTRGQQLLPQAGARLLRHARLVLDNRRDFQESGKGLWLCGLDDLWEGKPDLTRCLAGIPADQPRLVLAHNPDTAELQPNGRVDLMVSGHTHGGQVYVPGLGTPVVPSSYGQKYAAGFVQAPGYWVYVTRGVGVGGLPVRLGVPPEVTFFELQPSNQGLRFDSGDYLS
jgi:uncharacterized protein